MKQFYNKYFLLSCVLFFVFQMKVKAQVQVTFNALYSQNFDGYLGTSAASLPAGWSISGNFVYRGTGNGGSNSGGSWAYGTGAERSLGYLGSGSSSSINYTVSCINNTGTTITSLNISYDFEQWRFIGDNNWGWSVTGTGALSGVNLTALNTNSTGSGTTGIVSVTPKIILLTGLNIAPGAAFGINWSCGNGPGNDNGIAIDNFQLIAPCPQPVPVIIDTTLCAGATFTLNGVDYTTAQVIHDTLVNSFGCDSVISFNLGFFPQITYSFANTICNGQTYNWGTQSLNATGTFTQVFPSSVNCDSTVTLNLFVRPQITHTFADTICNGQTYTWGTQSLNATGTFTQVFPSSVNCDSTVTLNLFVRPQITHAFADTICNGQTYTWGAQSLTTSGTYNQTFSSITCDSTVTLNLFARPQITHTFADTICNGQTYTWGIQSLNATGTFTQVFPSSVSCDSTVTLNLFVRPQITYSFADTICNGQTYTWGAQSLNTTGTFTQVFPSSVNCDSTVTLNLFVRPQITHTFVDTICNGQTYTWGAQSLNATGTFTQVFSSSVNCDSTVTLNLFVRPQITYSFADTICNGQTYTWGTQSLNTTGTFTQVFPSSVSCDSTVTLNLFVRPQITYSLADTICNGQTYNWGTQSLNTIGTFTQVFPSSISCDSTVTLNLFVQPSITYNFADTICNGQTYTWGTQSLNATGTFTQIFPSSVSCDSTVTLNLFVRPQITYSFADTICNGQTYTWGTQSLNATGTFTQVFPSSVNCDSTVTLNLFVRPQITHTFVDTICNGQTYTWGTQSLNATGTFTQVFPSSVNCDSTVTLNLFVRSQITHNFADTICNGQTYTWGIQSLNATGTFTQIFPSSVSCDSTVTLNLFVRPQITHTFVDTICNGQTYTWGTQSLNATGTFTQVFSSSITCDSTVTLNLFVQPSITHNFADTICNGQTYTWGTQSLNATGTFTQVFPSSVNCDSTVTLNLFVHPQITHTFADTICNGQTYTWGTQSLNATGTFTQVFSSSITCDSTVTLNLFVQPSITHNFADTICNGQTYTWGTQSLNATGTFTQVFPSSVNCDSTVTLNLFVQPSITYNFADTICNGQTYTWGTQSLNATGTFTQIFPSSVSCDSTVTLNLFVRPQITYSFADTICNGQTYTWGTQSLNAIGTFTQVFSSSVSCDSTVTLNLFVLPQITHSFADTICNGQTYTWGTQSLNATGTFTQVFSSSITCDSTVTLNLFVHPQITHTFADTICYGQTYNWGTQSLGISGIFTQVFPSANNCDSTVTLSLFVRPAPGYTTIDTAGCGIVIFEGIQYQSNISLSDTILNAVGCDSLYRTINIVVHNNNIIHQVIDTAGCETVLFEGISYNENTVLHHIFISAFGCDSIERTVNIHVLHSWQDTTRVSLCEGSIYDFHGQRYSNSGVYEVTYHNAQGCDSNFVLILEINPLPGVTIESPANGSFCVGDSIELEAEGAQEYNWTDEYGASLGEGPFQHVFLYAYSNSFTVNAKDGNGCQDTASVTIKAQPCCNIWMPNAFSPNGDGLNDVFKPETNGHPGEYALYIFNRWGQIVFSSFNITEGWNGYINGSPANIDTYHYRISGKCVNGDLLDKKGELTLIR